MDVDRALDEIVSERHRGGRTRGRRGGRRNDRNDYPRDGIRKSTREDNRNIDSEWVHDKFDDNCRHSLFASSNLSLTNIQPVDNPFEMRDVTLRSDPSTNSIPLSNSYVDLSSDAPSAKLRVENLHYELTEEDLDDLFNRIGPVIKLELLYDRSGRSDGVAYITYESHYDAKKAIREFDGANAKGQPIRLTAVPTGPTGGGRRNPFDSVIAPGRPLEDRISMPKGRSRSDSPMRGHSDVSGPPPTNVDRYVPGQGRRSRSPAPRRRDGRPPGARRERGERRGGRGGRGGENLARDGRPRKTQEELDAEMEDYWGGKENGASADAPAESAAPAVDDVEMVE
ncbi:Aly/REF export factor [Lachnellula occidentalis]|uniref:Aly/REF export factor n=1 Tax=Lachnellula occidentalis TaxID=215460 RepID=A0A8H8UF83_9HELO|nr:Aly/REF export factor [Lachnellula occidentalis]